MRKLLFVLISVSLLTTVTSCKKESPSQLLLDGTQWNVTEYNPSKNYSITLNANGTTNLGGSWRVTGSDFTMSKSWTNYTGTLTGSSINGTWMNTTSNGTFTMVKK